MSGARPIVKGRPSTLNVRLEPSGRTSRRRARGASTVGTTNDRGLLAGENVARRRDDGRIVGVLGLAAGRDDRVTGLDRDVRDEGDRRPVGQPVVVAAGELQGGVGEVGGKRRVGLVERGEVRHVEMDGEPVRDDRAVAVAHPTRFHRPLDAALELDRLELRVEQAGRLPLEEALEEPLEGGEGSHDRWRSLAGSPFGSLAAHGQSALHVSAVRPCGFAAWGPGGTIGTNGRYLRLGSLQTRAIYSPPVRSTVPAGPGFPRYPGGTMPEILTESFCERCGTRYTFESDAPREDQAGHWSLQDHGEGSEELRHERRDVARRGDGRRPERRRARAHRHQLDAFHATFNFCMTCRQYTCGNCWNDAEGRCLTCAPHLGHEIMPAPFPELPVAAAAPIAIEAWPTADLEPDEDEIAAAEAAPPDEIDAADRLDRLSATADDVVPTWLAAAEADALAAAEAQAIVEAVDEPEIAAVADETFEPMAAVPEPEPDAAELAIAAAAAVAHDTTAEASDEAPLEVAPATEEPPIAAIAEVAAAAAIVDAVAAEPAVEPIAEPPAESDDRAAAATLATAALLGRFRPGRSIDAELEAYEAAVAASEAAAAAKILGAQEAETAPEAAELPAPEAGRSRWRPLPTSSRSSPCRSRSSPSRSPPRPEPEPVAAEAEVAEPVAAEVAAIAADEAPVAAELDEPVVEPESIAAAAALAAATAPEATPEPARTDVVEQPTWRIIAPDSTSAPTNGHAPDALPAAATAIPAEPLPSEPPQWPSSPEWPQPNPALLNQRTVAPSAAMEALWAASARDVVAPVQGGPVGGVQSCNSCGLSLSANARFCRRCGTRQG